MASKRARNNRGQYKKQTRRSRGVSKMKRVRRAKKMTLPLAVIAGFAPFAVNTVKNVQSQGLTGLQQSTKYLIPYDPATRKMSFDYLPVGLFPILGGWLVHKVVGGMLGVNRMLSSAGVPFIRI